jgi:hypothetical protein
VYTSDQGFYLGEHGWFDKRLMFEESLRTPLLIKWHGIIEAGTTNSDLIFNLDFGETFIDVAPNWPEIRVIYNSAQFWSFAYMWPMVVPDRLRSYMEGEWFTEHIKFNHGPLLENWIICT